MSPMRMVERWSYARCARAGLFYFTWGSDAKKPDPYSVYRCGSLTQSGHLAIAPE